MAKPVITPYRGEAIAPLTGHFVTGPEYAAWRPDGTDDYLLIYTVSGGGRFGSADGHHFHTAPGDLVLLRPGTRHDYATPAGERWELLWSHFLPRGDWLDLLDWPADWPGVARLREAQTIDPFLRRLHAVALSADPLRDRLAMNALEALLLACDGLNPGRAHRRVDPRLRQVLEHIAARLDRPLTVDGLAEVGGLSVSRLAHLFRAALGVSVMHYVEARRIERAGQLLRMTSLDVKQVARQVGFSSPFYFSLRFKKATGHNPSAYRSAAASPRPAVTSGE